MHELSVCQALIRQVETIAREKQAQRVTRVTLAIGPLSGVEADLLRNAYPIAIAGSVAESSQLDIETLPIRVRCNSCGHESDASMNKLVCADCGDWHTTLISGDELLLMQVELENPSDANQQRVH